MKKFLSLILSFSIIYTSISSVSAMDMELPKSLDSFTEDVSNLINEYNETKSYEDTVFFTAEYTCENSDVYDTNRLIVKSSHSIDPLDSINYVGGYNDLHILQFANDADCDEAYEYYSSLPGVQYVQEDGILTETAVEETAETFTEASVGISSQYQSDIFGYTNAKANMGSAEVTIAVVDTGVQNDHEYLAGRVIPTGFDSVYNESCYDKRGHGTHVAGIIVSNTKSNVKIRPYKVIGDDGTGTDTQLYLGIQAAIEDGVDIINLSLTRKGESEIVHEAVQNAYNAGITVVAAAGNDNVNLDQTFYTPACFDEVICVVSIDTNKKRASTSNWRFNDTLSAPGVDILSSYLDNTYKIMSGTSMATPFISCCVAYLLATGENYTPESVYTTLYNNTQQGATASIHYVVPGELINSKNTCVTPVFKYSSGEFSGYLNVEITCDTPGATIMYRTSDMNSNTYYEYTGPVRIDDSATFTAYAFCKNYKTSASVSATYTKSDVDASLFVVDENGVLTGYNGTGTDVDVPDFINGTSVLSVSDTAFGGNTELTHISFGNYLTTIGEGAFKGCTALTSVYASGCTDIEAEAFSWCNSLTTVSIPNVVTIGNKAFFCCSALTKASFSKLTVLGERAFEDSGLTTFSAAKLVTIGDYAFSGSPLKTFSSSNVTTVGTGAFENCNSLTSVTLTKVSLMGKNSFNGCESLKSASFGYLTVIPESAFKNCISLTSAYFSSATAVESNAFNGCSALATVSLPKVTTIDNYAFCGCSALKSFAFTKVTSIGDYAFSETGLESIVLPNVTEFGEKVFYNSTAVKSIEMPVATTFDTLSFAGLPNVENLILPRVTEFAFNGGPFSAVFPKIKTLDNENGVEEIPDGFLEGCSQFESGTFRYYLYVIGANAFKGTALKEAVFEEAHTFGENCFADIPTLEKVSMRRFGSDDSLSIFFGSENINSIYLSGLRVLPDNFRCSEQFPHIRNFDSSVSEVTEYAFKDCSELTYYNFTYTETIGTEAFCGTAITKINGSGVTSVGAGAFKDCTNLGVVKLPLLTDIDLNVFENSEANITELDLHGVSTVTEEDTDTFNFSKFPGLKNVDLSSVTVLPARAFKGCPVLESVTLNKCTKICEEAFAYCTSLVDLKLNSATSIGKNAFLNCTSLQNFEADSVTSFDFTTFDGCANLKSLSFNSLLEIPVDSNGKLDINNLDNLESFSADKLAVIPDNFFKGCEKLTTVSFASATDVGDYAFYNTALSEFTMPLLETVGSYAFYGTGITNVNLPKVTDVGEYAFALCPSLLQVELPKAEQLSISTFEGSSAITSLFLPSVTTLPVTDDGASYVSDKPLLIAFNCDNVNEIPADYFVNNPNLANVSMVNAKIIGDRAFMNVLLNDEFYYDGIEVIGDYAFYGTEFSSIDTYCIKEIGDYAFANCSYLTDAYIYNDEYLYEGTGEIKLGKGIFENDTKLVRAYLMNNDIALPDYTFKNCTKLNWVLSDDVRTPTAEDYADIISVGEEAFYGCNAMRFESIDFMDIEYIGKNAFVGLNDDQTGSLELPNLKYLDEGAFGDSCFSSLEFENVEIIKDIPDCSYVLIGSDIKEFSCESTDTIIYAYENSVVDEFCTENGLNFKKYDGIENILTDVAPLLTGYDCALSFGIVGFNTTYEWYACNNPDRSDAVHIDNTSTFSQIFDPISLFVDDYEENKYTYFYCVATSTENGNVLKTQSRLCKNIFATIRGTDDTFIDFIEGDIFTHSLDNINTLDNIFTVDGDIRVTPSYSTDNETCYGSGTVVEIMNGDEVALTQTIVVYGDVNGDGVVDALDVSRIEKVSNGNSKEFDNKYCKIAADTDGSGSIDAIDYQTAVNKALAS